MAPTMIPFLVLHELLRLPIPRSRIALLKLRGDDEFLWRVEIYILNSKWRLRVFLHDLQASLGILWGCHGNETVVYVDANSRVHWVRPFVIFGRTVPYFCHLIPDGALGIEGDE